MKKLIIITLVFIASNAYAADFSFREIQIGKSIQEQKLPQRHFVPFKFDKDYENKVGAMVDVIDLPSIGIKSTTYVNVIEGMIEKITMTFHADDAKEVYILLVLKYGKTRINSEIVQNGLGTKFERIFSEWNFEDVKLFFTNISYQATKGLVVIETAKYRNWRDKQEYKQREKYKNNL